jgi:hypothetical protein
MKEVHSPSVSTNLTTWYGISFGPVVFLFGSSLISIVTVSGERRLN